MTKVEQAIHPRKIYAVVNNAGIVSGSPLLELESTSIEKTFRVNTFAHFWMAQAVLPGMLQQKEGLIVTMASVVRRFSIRRISIYLTC